MVRPHFIKMTPGGKSHGILSNRAVASKNRVLSLNNDKAPDQSQVRAYSPVQSRRCETMKEPFLAGSSSQFLDIDGNESIALDRPIDLAPKDTSHKIQRHLSLYDLTQLPQSIKTNKSSFSNKSGAKCECSKTGNTYRSISCEDKRGQLTLPKGSEQLNQPYVVPKFMPSFREILKETKKETPMVSITESTPPSLQKWAVEWNSEPKSLSISELKEDIMREAEERIPRREGNRYSASKSSSEGRRYYEAKSSIEAMLRNDVTSKAHDRQRWQTVPQPVKRGVVFSPHDYQSETANLDWLPEKFSRLKNISDGSKRNEYSFAKAISRKDFGSAINHHSDLIPRIFKPNNHVYDEDEQEFYEWFKHKLSKASESSRQSEQHLSNGVEYSSRMSSQNDKGSSKTVSPQREPNIGPLAGNIPETHAPPVRTSNTITASEKNSSFYQWLSSRVCIPVDRSSWREKPKPETNSVNETGDLKTSKYPWSSSYSRKPAPNTEGSSQVQNGVNVGNASLNESVSPNATAVYKKVKSQITLKRPTSSGVRKAKSLIGIRPASAKKLRKDRGEDAVIKKSVPYSQWVVSSELDHIRNLRGSIMKDRSTEDNTLGNSSNSQQLGNSPVLKYGDAIGHNKQSVGSWWAAKESITPLTGKSSSPNSSSLDVSDANGFFAISDDAIPIMDLNLQNSQTSKVDTYYRASECYHEEECDAENCIESTDQPPETSYPFWSIANHQQREVDFPPNDSVKHVDSDDPKLNADDAKLKFEGDLLNEEAATDAEWNRAVGPRSIWPNDNDLIKRLGGEVTKIDLFSLSSHSRPL